MGLNPTTFGTIGSALKGAGTIAGMTGIGMPVAAGLQLAGTAFNAISQMAAIKKQQEEQDKLLREQQKSVRERYDKQVISAYPTTGVESQYFANGGFVKRYASGGVIPQSGTQLASNSQLVQGNPMGHNSPGGDVPLLDTNGKPQALAENGEVVLDGDKVLSDRSGHALIGSNIAEAQGVLEKILSNVNIKQLDKFQKGTVERTVSPLKNALEKLDTALQATYAQQELMKQQNPIMNAQNKMIPQIQSQQEEQLEGANSNQNEENLETEQMGCGGKVKSNKLHKMAYGGSTKIKLNPDGTPHNEVLNELNSNLTGIEVNNEDNKFSVYKEFNAEYPTDNPIELMNQKIEAGLTTIPKSVSNSNHIINKINEQSSTTINDEELSAKYKAAGVGNPLILNPTANDGKFTTTKQSPYGSNSINTTTNTAIPFYQGEGVTNAGVGVANNYTPTYTEADKATNTTYTGKKGNIPKYGKVGLQDVVPFADNLVNMVVNAKMPKVPTPLLERPVAMSTDYNINPQLQDINNQVSAYNKDINNTMTNANSAAANKLAGMSAGISNKNLLYGEKANAENILRNTYAQNVQNVQQRNVGAVNDFGTEQMNRTLSQQQNLTSNVANGVEDFNKIVEDKRAEGMDNENAMLIGLQYLDTGVIQQMYEMGMFNDTTPKFKKLIKDKLAETDRTGAK